MACYKRKTLNNFKQKRFIKYPNDTISIPKGAIHRIETLTKNQPRLWKYN